MSCAVSHCAALLCTVHCCSILFCSVLCTVVLFYSVLFCTVHCCSVLFCSVLFWSQKCCNLSVCAVLELSLSSRLEDCLFLYHLIIACLTHQCPHLNSHSQLIYVYISIYPHPYPYLHSPSSPPSSSSLSPPLSMQMLSVCTSSTLLWWELTYSNSKKKVRYTISCSWNDVCESAVLLSPLHQLHSRQN